MGSYFTAVLNSYPDVISDPNSHCQNKHLTYY